ncbi:MAG TPA: hypothetical protein DIT65_04165 [Cryomorphaceae bacterium]|nr:hypothetical protein [Cryomorphaceae bacterium]|tara:strand:+ start:6337 stop:6549 length:213 start_codon:yes stop_codon:yes gene_type:complete
MANPPDKNERKFLRFGSLGAQMAVLIYAGSELGKYLDTKYPADKNWYTMACVLGAVAISFYQLIKELPKN